MAETNSRIVKLRRTYKLSRAELATYTGYSRSYVDNWLVASDSPNFREAPANAVRLLEFELGLRGPQLAGRRKVVENPVVITKKLRRRRRG